MPLRNNSEKWELTFKITGVNLTKEEILGKGGLQNEEIQSIV
ncbi:hypothetical protein V7121_16255 [Neobacillus drentensis]